MKKNSIIITALVASLLVGCTNGAGTKQNLIASAPTQKEAIDGKIPKKLSEYWPTNEWRTSLPEQQGMDSSKLADLLEALNKKNSPIQGLLVIRNGYIVTEKYTGMYNKTMSHAINSVTKSVTSALTGVAIKEGYIKSVNDHVLDYFPNSEFDDSEHKKSITIENLLTMSAGLEWPEIGEGADHSLLYRFETASNQVQFILDHPMDPKKINTFNYDSGLTHLLSAIIQQKTGMTALDYANKEIFHPIGINSATWIELRGVNNGGYGISMTPRDMARFGFLYMNKGNWNGKQILPADWVETSLKQHLLTGRSADEGYGYFFWTEKSSNGYDIICAMGDKGQYIFMVPKYNLLIVTTSSNWEDLDIIDGYVVPSIKSNEPIPVNQKANARLAKLEKKK